MEKLNTVTNAMSFMADILSINVNESALERCSRFLLQSYSVDQILESIRKVTVSWKYSYFPKPATFIENMSYRAREEVKNEEFCIKCNDTGIRIKEEGIYKYSYRCSCRIGSQFLNLPLA